MIRQQFPFSRNQPVRTGRVGAPVMSVEPTQRRCRSSNNKPEKGYKTRGGDEDEYAERIPYVVGDENQRRQENEAENHDSEDQTGEEEQNAAGD